jgi:hypothetical protein
LNTSFSIREAKRLWAWRNKEKKADYDKRYRQINAGKVNRQSAIRMRRFRAKQKRAAQG